MSTSVICAQELAPITHTINIAMEICPDSRKNSRLPKLHQFAERAESQITQTRDQSQCYQPFLRTWSDVSIVSSCTT